MKVLLLNYQDDLSTENDLPQVKTDYLLEKEIHKFNFYK